MIRNLLKIILLLCLLCACSKEPEKDELLLGSWRSQAGSIHTIMTFRANGSWQWEQKIEGRFSKIIEKKKRIEGKWELVEGRLRITPGQSELDEGWQKDQAVLFEVAEINRKVLTLKTAKGDAKTLQRVRSNKMTGDDEEDGMLILNLGPLVTNLSNGGRSSRERYICVDMDFVFEVPEASNHEPLPKVHPRIRELVLFYLSSQRYEDIRTFHKIRLAMAELREMLLPYFKEDLKEIEVRRVIITAKLEKVDWFLNGASELPPR